MRTYFLLFFLASLGDSINGFGQCSIDVEPSANPQSTCFNIPFNNSISIQASGSNLSYQWYSNNNASNVGGSSIANETSGSLTPPCNSVGSTYYYCVVSANGSVCATSVISGEFSVISNNTVGAASSSPTLCINTALTNITHSTTGATGIGTATNLPAGVTAAFAGNTITISGTPTVSGTFNYSIPLTGGCGSVNATGMITVTPANTVFAASSTPTLCINTLLTNITHTTTGSTGIGTATNLPAGVTAAFAGNTITISGTPTASGTFNYSIPLTGGCGSVNAAGTITVNPSATVNAGIYSPICAGESITLSGLIGGSATSSTWSGGTGQFSNNSNLNTTYFPSPPEVSSGSVILTLTTNDPAGPCIAVNDTVTITINPADFVFANNGDDTLSICSGNETTLFGTGANFYIWSGGIQDSVPFIAQSSGWYEVTGYLSNTCFDNAFVFLSVLPSPNFDLPYDTLICSGSSIILYDSSFNESISWNWGNSAVYDLLIPENSGYLSYEASLQNGCTKSDSINLILITTPSSTILGDTVLCSNSSWVNFSVLNTGNQIEWEVINGQIQGQAYNTIFVNFDSTTIASIIVQESVWGTSCTGSDTIYIALSEGLALEPAQISTLFPGSNILVSDFDYPEMNWGYESKISGNPIYVNQFNQYCEFIPLDTVNYYYWVEVGDGNGCLTKSYFNSPNYASNFEFEEPSMELFPNPTSNLINLKTNLPFFTYKVQTLNGLIVNYGNAEFATSIDLADLADGVYYIHLSYKDRTFVNKIIKINA